MHLSALRLTNYRNFTAQTLDFPPEGVAIVGNNGQGKTNLLEAIYYLSIFRSFRGARDEELVRFGAEVFRIEGRVEARSAGVLIAAAYDRRQKRKKVTLDGVEPPRIGEALGRLGAVIFSPSDVAIIAGSPAVRRRFLDILLSLTEPRYLEELQRYRQILLQRNALLRQGAAPPLVAAWNEGLIALGSRVIAARLRWSRARAPSFAARVAEISGGTAASLELDPSFVLPAELEPDPEGIAERFRAALEQVAERELRRGVTLVGPHRDDLRIRAASGGGGEWVELRAFGSGGQQRTAAVALRMVEAETLAEHRGARPVLLLDDIFAELDTGRAERILDWIERDRSAQVILTTPNPRELAVRGGTLPVWRIERGELAIA